MSAIYDLKHLAKDVAMSSRQLRSSEMIEITARRFGYFPKVFVHQGHSHVVCAVERFWTVSRCRGRVERHCFRVRCPEGTFDVYHDVRHDTWHLERRMAGP